MSVKKTAVNEIGKGKPGPGRPKGIPNKTTKIAKEAIAEAADRLGGADRIVAWAKEDPANERVFWGTVYPKLLPIQISGDPDGSPIQTVTKIELVSGERLNKD